MVSLTVRHVAQAAVVLAALSHSTVLAQQNITDDTYFYGESPPVYPSRKRPWSQPPTAHH